MSILIIVVYITNDRSVCPFLHFGLRKSTQLIGSWFFRLWCIPGTGPVGKVRHSTQSKEDSAEVSNLTLNYTKIKFLHDGNGG